MQKTASTWPRITLDEWADTQATLHRWTQIVGKTRLALAPMQNHWWQIVLYTLATTHITIAAVTIFLHRAQAHRALDLHGIPSHFFRFWLWLGSGMVTKEWVAIHRKHHARVETADDPHSPQTRGIGTVLLQGTELYRAEAKNQETLEKYGTGTPDVLSVTEPTLVRSIWCAPIARPARR